MIGFLLALLLAVLAHLSPGPAPAPAGVRATGAAPAPAVVAPAPPTAGAMTEVPAAGTPARATVAQPGRDAGQTASPASPAVVPPGVVCPAHPQMSNDPAYAGCPILPG